jgi:hypothetical protein
MDNALKFLVESISIYHMFYYIKLLLILHRNLILNYYGTNLPTTIRTRRSQRPKPGLEWQQQQKSGMEWKQQQ